MDFIQFLDQAIATMDQAKTVRTRVVKTVGESVKILTAINAADLGETERAIFSRLLTLSEKTMLVLQDPAVPPQA